MIFGEVCCLFTFSHLFNFAKKSHLGASNGKSAQRKVIMNDKLRFLVRSAVCLHSAIYLLLPN